MGSCNPTGDAKRQLGGQDRQIGKIRQVVVPCASSLPDASTSRPSDVAMREPVGVVQEARVVGELGPGLGVNMEAPNLGNRVDIYDKQGKRLARLGDIRAGEKPGQFIAPHGIALGSNGDGHRSGQRRPRALPRRVHGALRLDEHGPVDPLTGAEPP